MELSVYTAPPSCHWLAARLPANSGIAGRWSVAPIVCCSTFDCWWVSRVPAKRFAQCCPSPRCGSSRSCDRKISCHDLRSPGPPKLPNWIAEWFGRTVGRKSAADSSWLLVVRDRAETWFELASRFREAGGAALDSAGFGGGPGHFLGCSIFL